VLDIEPTMAYALIDRMLGGDPEPGDTIKRPLTEIESRLINRAIRLYLQQLQDVWENVLPVEFAVERIESNPQLVQIVSPNEVIILVGMELTMGKIRGMLNLCIPFTTIERYAPQLSNTSWAGGSRNRATEESQRTVGRRLEAAEVEVIVTLARSRIRTADLLSLSPGDIITTEQDVDSPLQVSVANVPKFDARAGAYRGKKAICISGQTNPPPAGPSSS
jgi:flagellar motor switch protein FliM